MKQHSSGFIIGIVVSLVLGFSIVAGIALGLRASGALGYEPGVWKAQKTGPNSASLELATMPDSQVCHPNADSQKISWVTYCPSTTLEVPANSIITVTIRNYDSSTSLINDYFATVHGTIGGTMTVNGKTMTHISPDAPGHTFTLQSVPNAPYPLFVSVPLMGVSSNAKPVTQTIFGVTTNSYPQPNVITFQFRTGPPGTYIWHCYDPCGDTVYARNAPFGFSGPMSTTGYMAGTLTVTNY
jgi:hypothetical protein